MLLSLLPLLQVSTTYLNSLAGGVGDSIVENDSRDAAVLGVQRNTRVEGFKMDLDRDLSTHVIHYKAMETM